GIAALYVVLNHSRGNLWAGYRYVLEHDIDLGRWGQWVAKANVLTRLGEQFVTVFFVLSGFSIAHSLARRNDVVAFLERRLVRLYPPYLVALAYAAAISLLIGIFAPNLLTLEAGEDSIYAILGRSQDAFSLKKLTLMLLYVDKNAFTPQFWSLTHEWIFYLTVPFCLRLPRTYIALSLLLYPIGLWLEPNVPGILIRYLVYNGYFVVGIVCFRHYDRTVQGLGRLPGRVLAVLLLACFAGMLAANVFAPESPLSSILAALLAVLGMAALLEHRVQLGLLERLGEFSYTLYLTHFATVLLVLAVLHGVFGFAQPILHPLLWVVAVPVTIAAAWVLYWAGEYPTRRWLLQLRKADSNKPAAAIQLR
ncbi:MAG TPA: acyltransferase, partial [Polyangiaceae bacterium]|nr:acyltransferase [Polyangiaceae bacterium]